MGPAGDGGNFAAGTAAANTGPDGTETGTQGLRDDGVTGMDGDETGGKKKMNPLKKVIEAVKNI